MLKWRRDVARVRPPLLPAVLFCLLALTGVLRASTEAVLVLHSYYPDYVWTQQLNKGISDILNARANLELYYEYLDSRRRSDDELKRDYYNLLQRKYSNVQLKAIIACDNSALAFLKRYPISCPACHSFSVASTITEQNYWPTTARVQERQKC